MSSKFGIILVILIVGIVALILTRSESADSGLSDSFAEPSISIEDSKARRSSTTTPTTQPKVDEAPETWPEVGGDDISEESDLPSSDSNGIKGRAIDRNGEPCIRADVHLYATQYGPSGGGRDIERQTKTDTDGQFEFHDIDPGTKVVNLALWRDGVVLGTDVPIKIIGDELVDIGDISLERSDALTIKLRIENEKAQPIVGAWVAIVPYSRIKTSRVTHSDETGQVAFQAWESGEEVMVEIMKDGYKEFGARILDAGKRQGMLPALDENSIIVNSGEKVFFYSGKVVNEVIVLQQPPLPPPGIKLIVETSPDYKALRHDHSAIILAPDGRFVDYAFFKRTTLLPLKPGRYVADIARSQAVILKRLGAQSLEDRFARIEFSVPESDPDAEAHILRVSSMPKGEKLLGRIVVDGKSIHGAFIKRCVDKRTNRTHPVGGITGQDGRFKIGVPIEESAIRLEISERGQNPVYKDFSRNPSSVDADGFVVHDLGDIEMKEWAGHDHDH